MKYTRRDEKFIHRVVVLAAAAIAMGIAVTAIKESREVEKLIEPSVFRDASLLFTPFAALALSGYGLAHKTFSSGNLLAEFLALLGCYCFFLSVSFPSFSRREFEAECRFWELFCSGGVSARDYRFTFIFIFLGLAFIVSSFVRAGIIKWGVKGA
jgi:hypothetical protein